MSNAFAPAPAGSEPPAPLAEVLAVHEKMLVQLHLELLGAVHNAGFLSDLIAQHEKVVAALRTTLEHPSASAAGDVAIVITGEASSATAKARITHSAQGASTVNPVSNRMTVKKPAGCR